MGGVSNASEIFLGKVAFQIGMHIYLALRFTHHSEPLIRVKVGLILSAAERIGDVTSPLAPPGWPCLKSNFECGSK